MLVSECASNQLFFSRLQWADYFDSLGIAYAFFSAADAVALQEERKKAGERTGEAYESDSESESESEDDVDQAATSEGDQAKDVDAEQGSDWESEDDNEQADVGALANGLQTVAVDEGPGTNAPPPPKPKRSDVPSFRQDRTKILTVDELEELFWSEAPDLAG
jgi:large subunit GTPase 1